MPSCLNYATVGNAKPSAKHVVMEGYSSTNFLQLPSPPPSHTLWGFFQQPIIPEWMYQHKVTVLSDMNMSIIHKFFMYEINIVSDGLFFINTILPSSSTLILGVTMTQ